MKLEKLVLLFVLPTTWWNSGWVELIGCALREGGILFPLLPLLRAFCGAKRGRRRCSGVLEEEHQKADVNTLVIMLLVDLREAAGRFVQN